MKFLIASFCLAILLMICEPIQGAKICVSHVETCSDNVPVCGRFGGSNLCKTFKNQCEFEIFNCASSTAYKVVNAELCKDIPVNVRTTCSGIQTGPIGGGKFPHWGGNKHGFTGCGKGKKCGIGKGSANGGLDDQGFVINAGK